MGANNLSYSKNGVSLTESFEGGRRLIAYQDSKGVWTIGWGHTGPEVHEGLVIDEEDAASFLIVDVTRAVLTVNTFVDVVLTQNEFDALVDFVFNVGRQAFIDSTMLRLLNAGDLQGAADEFDKWDHCGGQVLAGLLRRREAEAALFSTTGQISA